MESDDETRSALDDTELRDARIIDLRVERIKRKEEHIICDCGCDLYYATHNGLYCSNCGMLLLFGIP